MQGNNFYKKLGERISFIRKTKKFSQYQLADKAKINRSYLAMVESGKSNPSVKFLRKLALILKIKLSDLFRGL